MFGNLNIKKNIYQPGIFYLFWAAFLSWFYFLLGPYSYLRWDEELDGALPRIAISAQQWLNSFGTTFNPFLVAGHDNLAGDVYFDFAIILYNLFPIWLALGAIYFLQIFITSYFTYRAARDVFNTGTLSALAGGLVATSQIGPPHAPFYFVANMGLTLALIPALIWIFNRCTFSGLKGYFLAFMIGMLYAMSGLYIYTVFVTAVFVCTAWLFIQKKFWPATLTALVFALGVCVVEIWPVLAAKSLSLDSTRSFYERLPTKIGLIKYVWRDFLYFAGPALGLLLIYRKLPGKPLLAAIAVFLLAAFGLNIVLETIAHSGILNNVFDLTLVTPRFHYPARLLLGIIVALSLAGIASAVTVIQIPKLFSGGSINFSELNLFTRPVTDQDLMPLSISLMEKNFRVVLNPVSIYILAVFCVIAYKSAVFSAPRLHKLAHGSTYHGFLQHPDLQAVAQSIDFQDPYRVATLPESGEVEYLWSPLVSFRAATASLYGLETLDGLNLLMPHRFQALQQVAKKMDYSKFVDGNHPTLIRKVVQSNYAYLPDTEYMLEPPPRMKSRHCSVPQGTFYADDKLHVPVLSLYGVKYLISRVPLQGEGLELLSSSVRERQLEIECLDAWQKFGLLMQGEFIGPILYVYENTHALPRAFLVHSVQVTTNQKASLDFLAAADENILLQQATVSAPDIDAETRQRLTAIGPATGTVRIIARQDDYYHIEVETSADSLLIITENQRQPWQATLDNQAVETFPVYHALTGLIVPAGRHQIELEYDNTVW